MPVQMERSQIRVECEKGMERLMVLSESAIEAGLSPSRSRSMLDSLLIVAKKSFSNAEVDVKILEGVRTAIADATAHLECIQRNGERFQALARFHVDTWLVGMDAAQRQQFLKSDLGKRIVRLLCQCYMDLPAEKVRELERLSHEPILRVLTRSSSFQSRLAEAVMGLVSTNSSTAGGAQTPAQAVESKEAGSANPAVSSEGGGAPVVAAAATGSDAQQSTTPTTISRIGSNGRMSDGQGGASSRSNGSSGAQYSSADASRVSDALLNVIGSERVLQFRILKNLCDRDSGRLVEQRTEEQGAAAGAEPVDSWIGENYRVLLNHLDPNVAKLPFELGQTDDLDKLFTHLASYDLIRQSNPQIGVNEQSAIQNSQAALKLILDYCQDKVVNTRIGALERAICGAGSWRHCSAQLQDEFRNILTFVKNSYLDESKKPDFDMTKADEQLGVLLRRQISQNRGLINDHMKKIYQYCIDQGLASDRKGLQAAIKKSFLYLLRDCVVKNSSSSSEQQKGASLNELLASILLNLHVPDNPQHEVKNTARYIPLSVCVGALIANKVLNGQSGGVLKKNPAFALIRSALGVPDKPKLDATNPASSVLAIVKPKNLFGLISGQLHRANIVMGAMGGVLERFVRQLNPDANLDVVRATKAAAADLEIVGTPNTKVVQATFSDERSQQLLQSQMDALIHQLVVGAPTQKESDENEVALNDTLKAQLSNVGLNLYAYRKAVEAADTRSKKEVRLSSMHDNGRKIAGMYYNDSVEGSVLKDSADEKILTHNGSGRNPLSMAISNPGQTPNHRNRSVLMSIAFRTAMWNTLTNNGAEVYEQLKVDGRGEIKWHGMMERLGLMSENLTNAQLIRLSKLILSAVSPEAFRCRSLARVKPENPAPVNNQLSDSAIATRRQMMRLGNELIGGVGQLANGNYGLFKGNLGTQLLDRLMDIGKKRGSDLCDSSDREVVNCLLGLMLAKSRVDYYGSAQAAARAGVAPTSSAAPGSGSAANSGVTSGSVGNTRTPAVSGVAATSSTASGSGAADSSAAPAASVAATTSSAASGSGAAPSPAVPAAVVSSMFPPLPTGTGDGANDDREAARIREASKLAARVAAETYLNLTSRSVDRSGHQQA